MSEQARYPLILWEMMQVLRKVARPLTRSEVFDAVEPRLRPTAYELGRIKSGSVRWQNILQWQSAASTTVGWMTKREGGRLLRLASRQLMRIPRQRSSLRSASAGTARSTSDVSRRRMR